MRGSSPEPPQGAKAVKVLVNRVCRSARAEGQSSIDFGSPKRNTVTKGAGRGNGLVLPLVMIVSKF